MLTFHFLLSQRSLSCELSQCNKVKLFGLRLLNAINKGGLNWWLSCLLHEWQPDSVGRGMRARLRVIKEFIWDKRPAGQESS